MEKIFFSYSRKDEVFALKLAKELQQTGADIWIDQLHIRPSEPWDEAIESALVQATCLLVILSSASVASDNVLNEINFGLEEKKQVLPIIIESGIRKPFNIRRLQHIDFTGSYGEAFHKLLEALAIEQSKEPVKKPATTEDLNGKWIAEELVNPFDKNDKFSLRLELEIMGNLVFGTMRKTSTDKSYDITKGFLDGKYNDGVLSFYTGEQSWLGSETVNFKDFYYGVKQADGIKFNMQSDRPWGFPAQKFVMKKEESLPV